MDLNQWLPKLIEWLEEIEKRDYSWSFNGHDNCKLSAAGLYCKLAKIYENHYDFDKEKLKDTLNKFKRQDGMFENIPGHRNIIAESRQAMSGLYNMGYKVDSFDASPFFKRPLFFMNDPSWTNPWDAGAQFSHHMFFCKFNENDTEIKKTLNELKLYQHSDGWYSSRPPSNVLINGIMKVFTGLDIIEYKMEEDHLKRILDFVLTSHSSSGGCNIYDYVYVLEKAIQIEYKVEESKEKLRLIYGKILEHQQPDGGFSYNKNSSQSHIYGTTITPGLKAGDIHGTTLFSMALSKIDNALDLGLNLSLAVS
tara:strand:- start:307 stop:1233 length:927 start_codon:yes stop_codon:yes gene_type:complete